MSKVIVTRTTNVAAARIWVVLADFGNVQNHNPMVKSAELLQERNSGVGIKRRCNFYNGTSLVEETTMWDEGRGFTIKLSKFSMPLKRAQASLHVVDVDSKSSVITFEMDFTVKYGLIGRIMDVMIMRRMIEKTLAKVLISLEHHVKTGELIGKNGAAVSKKHVNKSTNRKIEVT